MDASDVCSGVLVLAMACPNCVSDQMGEAAAPPSPLVASSLSPSRVSRASAGEVRYPTYRWRFFIDDDSSFVFSRAQTLPVRALIVDDSISTLSILKLYSSIAVLDFPLVTW